MTDTKTCTRCNTEKPLTEFYREKRVTTGLSAHCKSCHNMPAQKARHVQEKEFRDSGLPGTPESGWDKLDESDRYEFIAAEIAGVPVNPEILLALQEHGLR
jgi:hypothetical protein